jgi:hypothetical protein
MQYERPEVRDHGDLRDLTACGIIGNNEDASNKQGTIGVTIDPIVDLTLCVLP